MCETCTSTKKLTNGEQYLTAGSFTMIDGNNEVSGVMCYKVSVTFLPVSYTIDLIEVYSDL